MFAGLPLGSAPGGGWLQVLPVHQRGCSVGLGQRLLGLSSPKLIPRDLGGRTEYSSALRVPWLSLWPGFISLLG